MAEIAPVNSKPITTQSASVPSSAADPAKVSEDKKPTETTGSTASTTPIKEESESSGSVGAGVAQSTLAPEQGKKLYIVA